MMKTNMGSTDRVVRIIIAVAIAVLFFMNVISGILAILLLIVAGLFALTSLVSFCPTYLLFGISTKKKEV
jgi:hypothetical protein